MGKKVVELLGAVLIVLIFIAGCGKGTGVTSPCNASAPNEPVTLTLYAYNVTLADAEIH